MVNQQPLTMEIDEDMAVKYLDELEAQRKDLLNQAAGIASAMRKISDQLTFKRWASHLATKNPAAVELGTLGGNKGGAARARSLSPERRREIAQKAAKARWKSEN